MTVSAVATFATVDKSIAILISKRSAVFEEKHDWVDEVVDRPLRGRSILASARDCLILQKKAAGFAWNPAALN
jgi:hypothetical protein